MLAGLLVVGLLLAGAALYSPGDQWNQLRRTIGLQGGRLGEPPSPGIGGPHAFILTQDDSEEPVGFDPCRPIRYRVNPAGAPPDHLTYVETALERVTEATGLVFEYVGTSESRSFFRSTTGSRPPVLVGWATEEEVPELAGDVAGVAGSIAATSRSGRRELVTGGVVLDADVFGNSDYRDSALQAVVDHEFAHLVGLAHVDDPDQLMHPAAPRTDRFAAGDLEGLRRLGSLACH